MITIYSANVPVDGSILGLSSAQSVTTLVRRARLRHRFATPVILHPTGKRSMLLPIIAIVWKDSMILVLLFALHVCSIARAVQMGINVRHATLPIISDN